MKRVVPESVGDVLRQTLQEQGMTGRLYEARAIRAWPAVVGPDIAMKCGKPVVWNGVMTVYVRSAALRQELNMSRSTLVRLINADTGRDTLKDIRFK